VSSTVLLFTKRATLRRLTADGVDEYGNPDMTETETYDVPCHVRTLSSDEMNDNVAGERWKVYVGPSTDLSESDRVTVDGKLFEIVSVPRLRYNPRRRLHQWLECEIERRT
jgi:hypothetical protein